MRQSRRHSLLEISLNTASGFVLSIVVGQVVFPFLGISVTLKQNVNVVAILTVVSIVRSYVWRRIFDYLNYRKHNLLEYFINRDNLA